MAKSDFSAPSRYQVRESRRAKHISIRVSFVGEVEVVVPTGFDRQQIPEILHRRQEWIAKTTERIAAERQSFPGEAEILPTQLSLRSLTENWTVRYTTASHSPKAVTTGTQQVTIQGATDQPETCHRALDGWLRNKAKHDLVNWLRQVSQEIELPCQQISVRGQKTRWASCSSDKNISLNYRLLFLPAPLVHYVFVHELCHTVHLNHSARFWQLVKEKEPDYQTLDSELRRGWRYVPEWVEHLAK